MSIDTATAAKVAKLARIKVEEEALPALAEEFNIILGFIEQLNEVDVEGVEPMTSVTPQRLKRRVDEITDGDQQPARRPRGAHELDQRGGSAPIFEVHALLHRLDLALFGRTADLHQVALRDAIGGMG